MPAAIVIEHPAHAGGHLAQPAWAMYTMAGLNSTLYCLQCKTSCVARVLNGRCR